MSSLRQLLCSVVVLCVSVLPVLPQQCEQFNIHPQVGPDMPLIIPRGGSQRMTCSHPERPATLVDWYYTSSIIRGDNKVRECSCVATPINIGDELRELNFNNFAASSAGPYSCRVFIGAGLPTNSCRFEVKLAEEPVIQNPQPPPNRTVSKDGTLVFPVEASGVPLPTVTWRNGSRVLVNSSRISISPTGTLTVRGIMPQDRGDYSLNLTNIGGTLARSFSVFVPFVEITRISVPQVMNDVVMVTCEGSGYPRPTVQWRDSSNLAAETELTFTAGAYEDSFRSTLSVSRAQCEGSFICEAISGVTTTRRTTNFCSMVVNRPPMPMNVVVLQAGSDSVLVSWTVETSSVNFTIDVCYTAQSGGNEVCLGSTLPKTVFSTTVPSLSIGVTYVFRVVSVTLIDRTQSTGKSVTLSVCEDRFNVHIYGVSIVTALNDGERTFNISWRGVQDEVVRGYKVMEIKRGWSSMVNERVITNLVTPANFCNGEDHSFVVMATNNCGMYGPPSTPPVIAKCESPGRVRIVGVKSHSTALTVTWTLKATSSAYSIRAPLSITVLDLQLDGNSQQLELRYSIDSAGIVDDAQCLGDLKPSTVYKVCLHPVYSDNATEAEPICMDATTRNSDESSFDTTGCSKPEYSTVVGTPSQQALLPDYAIAAIVIALLILVAFVVCGIGICFACSNSKNKDIDDISSEYSSSIAPGMGMQGRMPSNHNRNMSPTRSCLSYHSKGHSTNWNDHMGTLREMDTEVGTNV